MKPVDLLTAIFVLGSTGMLLECYFTGAWSLLKGDRRATSTTYLWMPLVYGSAGLLFGFIHDWTRGTAAPLVAVLYTVLIYIQEFGWHWMFEKLLRVKVWDYGRGRWTFAGRVQPRYCLLWYAVACAFNPLHDFMMHVFSLVAKYG